MKTGEKRSRSVDISQQITRVLVTVEPTNEEWIAASHAVCVLSAETSLAGQP